MNRTALSTGSTSRRLPALLFVLLLALVAQTSGRPSSEDDLAIIPPDADNVEIHKVKFVNGVMQKDHPVIMYKEDFVSEDYDPTKNESSPVRHKKHKRTHHHREEPQQENDGDQILFDILPDKPIVLEEDLKAPLVNPIEVAELAEPVKKEAAGKHPKKYHSRQRRQAYLPTYPNEYVLQYYYSTPQKQNVPALIYFKRYQVQGKKPNLKGPPNRLDQTSVVVENRVTTRAPTPLPREPPAPRPPTFGAPSQRPQEEVAAPSAASEPKVSQCVWAIVNCCTADSKKVRYNCFEAFGCHGAFWDINPCASESVKQDDLVPLGGFSPPGFAQPESRPAPAPASRPRRPSSRTDGFHFPQDFGYQENSICQRASKICCSQRNIGSQYECFHHHGCNENISTIISTCS
ncbi:uncharacterized protein LOC108031607 isoform X2 [Drosophila biarmipes]|uniref:uncharacterized protein LOC108031607 isoform X2 n=1 Tax=Drosophila biarmipes TaxID=125945 RepID=UPI0007E66DC8|nr:uncharacterized protein LOC108031607 isoform X2 [Drosophila biarmipes]